MNKSIKNNLLDIKSLKNPIKEILEENRRTHKKGQESHSHPNFYLFRNLFSGLGGLII